MPCGYVVQFPKIFNTANLLVIKKLQHPIDIILKRTNKGLISDRPHNLDQCLLQTKTCLNTLYNLLIKFLECSLANRHFWLYPSGKVNCKVKHIHMTTILFHLLRKIDEILGISKLNVIVRSKFFQSKSFVCFSYKIFDTNLQNELLCHLMAVFLILALLSLLFHLPEKIPVL